MWETASGAGFLFLCWSWVLHCVCMRKRGGSGFKDNHQSVYPRARDKSIFPDISCHEQSSWFQQQDNWTTAAAGSSSEGSGWPKCASCCDIEEEGISFGRHCAFAFAWIYDYHASWKFLLCRGVWFSRRVTMALWVINLWGHSEKFSADWPLTDLKCGMMLYFTVDKNILFVHTTCCLD